MDVRKKLERALGKLDITKLTDKQSSAILEVLEKKSSGKEKPEPEIISLFEKIFERMPYAIAVTNSSGNFIKANKFFIELFGTEPGKDYGIFDDPVLRKAGYGKLLEKARKGEYAEIPELCFDSTAYHPERPVRKMCIKSIVFPIFNKNKLENFILIIEDISEKKKIESELLENEKRYRSLFESSRDAIMTLDPPLWNFTSGNPSTLHMFLAKDEAEFTSMEPWVLSPEFQPDGRRSIDKAKEMIGTAVQKGSHFFEWTHKRLNGEDFPATVLLTRMENNEKKFLQATVRDITQQKRDELVLKESEEKYREIFENATELVWTSDMNGNIISVNPVVEKYLGYKADELVNRNISSIFTADSYQQAREKIKFKIENQGESTIYEIVAVAKSGEHLFFEVSSKLKYKNNRPHSIFGIARNITERKKAEEELNKTREKYSELFNSSNDIIYTMDFKGNFTSVNPMAEKLLGYNFKEMDTPNMTSFITPETAKVAFDNIKSKVEGKRSSTIYEVEFMKKDGNYISLEINSQLRYQDGKPVEIFGIARDVTTRKKAEEELNKTREKYMELFNASNDIIYTMDFKGNFTSVNRTAEKLLGIKFEELTDVNVKKYLTPESAKRALADVVRKLRGQNENTIYEIDFININGNIVAFEINSQVRYINGKPYEVFGIARDVTERKKAIEALKNSEEKYRMIFENASLGIMTADIKGNILEINPVLLQMLGSKSVQDTKSINVLSYSPMIMAGLVEKFVKCIEVGEPIISEHTYTSKWGKTLETRIYTKPINNSRGKITGFQTIIEDITEQKKKEKLIRAALNEKEVLIREIHHRVKNNMQIIISLINMQMQDSNDAIMIRKFKELQQRVRSMSIIHEDLYMSDDLSRINFGNYLERLTNHLLQVYPHGKNLHLHFNVSDILLGIDTAIPCGLIVNELISNSLKYAFPDERTAKKKPCDISVEFTSEKDCYRLIVGDNGVGFPPDIEDVKSKSLGLLLVEILVSQLKGEMKVENKKGVRFEIEMEKEKERK